MYLIHARLRPPPNGELPADAAARVAARARPGDGLEHVVAHPAAEGGPVIGLFLTAPSLAAAEIAAAALCHRALAADEGLDGFTLGSCAAAFVAPFYERLLSAPGGPGRFGTGPDPSRPGPFHGC